MLTSDIENEMLETYKDDLPNASAFHQEVHNKFLITLLRSYQLVQNCKIIPFLNLILVLNNAP